MGKNEGRLSFSCLKLKGAAPTQGVCRDFALRAFPPPPRRFSVQKPLFSLLPRFLFLASAITSL